MFSIRDRSENWEKLHKQEIDLLVIGGGITGAGIALDAQSRGIQTVLVEKQDFAAGTSSRSTKLVHGGLRYLKQLEFSLVAEVGKERAIVYENGPHVTSPEWMLLPIIKGGTYGKLASSFGIWFYDWLAGVKKTERRKMLSVEETKEKEPLLRTEGLKGSGYYVEYRTDDARLTIEVMKKAAEYGAFCFNYTEVTNLLFENGEIVGVELIDHLSGEKRELYAKKIVNATGPWVDQLREIDGSKQGKTLHWTKGVHIVIGQKRFPLSQAIYFDTPDRRMVFAIPRDGKTYIGTTDTDYTGELENPRMTKEDRDYLIGAVNFMFPSIELAEKDVESSWVGIRPLIHEEGKSPSEISRKDEIFHSASGFITIAGGKLTGYRKMAEKVVDLVSRELAQEDGRVFPSCYTEQIQLSGGDVGGSNGWRPFIQRKIEKGVSLGLTNDQASRLIFLYGSNVEKLYATIEKDREKVEQYALPVDVYAMLQYSLQEELVAKPVDFFIRRTGALFFHLDWIGRHQEAVLQVMKEQLQWDEQQFRQYKQELEQHKMYAREAI